jgi:hypothetical protein
MISLLRLLLVILSGQTLLAVMEQMFNLLLYPIMDQQRCVRSKIGFSRPFLRLVEVVGVLLFLLMKLGLSPLEQVCLLAFSAAAQLYHRFISETQDIVVFGAGKRYISSFPGRWQAESGERRIAPGSRHVLVTLPASIASSLDRVFQTTYGSEHAEKDVRRPSLPISAHTPSEAQSHANALPST